MTDVAAIIRPGDEIHCVGCGYNLRTLAADGRCPECGLAVAETRRTLSAAPQWEISVETGLWLWSKTTFQILTAPRQFYRRLRTAGDDRRSKLFARDHKFLVALLLGITLHVHIAYLSRQFSGTGHWADGWFWILIGLCTWAAIALCSWVMATFAAHTFASIGVQKSKSDLNRVFNYHAAHWLPIAVVMFATVMSYYYLDWKMPRYYSLWNSLWRWKETIFVGYLVLLVAETISGGIYLYRMYRVAIRKHLLNAAY